VGVGGGPGLVVAGEGLEVGGVGRLSSPIALDSDLMVSLISFRSERVSGACGGGGLELSGRLGASPCLVIVGHCRNWVRSWFISSMRALVSGPSSMYLQTPIPACVKTSLS
jgi:hypothetical protein